MEFYLVSDPLGQSTHNDTLFVLFMSFMKRELLSLTGMSVWRSDNVNNTSRVYISHLVRTVMT